MSGSIGAALSTILMKPQRAIGTIIPDVVVEELHNDELAITMHPVEQGAPISDHAFKMPAEVIIRAGWSNSSAGFFAQDESYVNKVYQALLDLQASRRPFNLYTGKRFYPNMLIRSLAVTNDARWEYSLMVVARIQQVIIVSTQAVQVPPASAQANPANTAATQNTGPATPQAAQPSLLRQGADALGLTNTPTLGTPPT